MVDGAERFEVKPFIPPALCSGERNGEDTGSREEMGAFLTTEEGEPECGGAGEAPGEGVGVEEEEGGTAFAALARMERGMGFSSKSMSSKSSSFRGGAGGDEFLAGRGSRRGELIWRSTSRSLVIW